MTEKQDAATPGPVRLDRIMSPDHLKIISQASGGFSFAEDPSLPEGRMGYTNMQTRRIFINPTFLQTLPQKSIEGFLYHEVGHHAPESIAFQDMMLAHLGNPNIIPDAYKGSPESETRFFQALNNHLHNGLADVWLESFMGRRPYFPVRESYEALYVEMVDRETLTHLSKPEQLIQVLVGEDRYPHTKPIAQLVAEDVYQAYERLKKSGAIAALQDRKAFENYFATEIDKRRTLDRKYASYERAFLPEYLKLMVAELNERKEARQQAKQGQTGSGASQGQAMDDAVPLTQEEEQELKHQLLDQLSQAGQQYASHAPSPEEQNQLQNKIKQIKDELEERQRQIEQGQVSQKSQPEPQKKSGEDILRDLAEELQRKERERRMQGLANAMKIRQESVQTWNRIKERRRPEIESTAAALAEIFLDDRRKRLEYLKREGEIIPGLEYETVSALLSGELDPDTKMRTVQNPEFLETEIEWVVDTSGSMAGKQLEISIELMVIVTEAFKKVREDLAGEDLLMEDEQPFRIGVTTFSDKPERVTKLEDPIDDQKELTIIDKTSQVGGGTDESEAIAQTYKGMSLGQKNVIKMIIVLTDGYGNKNGVAPIIRQVEQDDEIIFLVVAAGLSEEEMGGVTATYIEPLQDVNKNVHVVAGAQTEENLTKGLDFIKRQVDQRRQQY